MTFFYFFNKIYLLLYLLYLHDKTSDIFTITSEVLISTSLFFVEFHTYFNI